MTVMSGDTNEASVIHISSTVLWFNQRSGSLLTHLFRSYIFLYIFQRYRRLQWSLYNIHVKYWPLAHRSRLHRSIQNRRSTLAETLSQTQMKCFESFLSGYHIIHIYRSDPYFSMQNFYISVKALSQRLQIKLKHLVLLSALKVQ